MMLKLDDTGNGGANGGAVTVDALCGNVDVGRLGTDTQVLLPADMDLSPSLEAIESLISIVDLSSFPDQIDTTSLLDDKNHFIHSLFSFLNPAALKAFLPPFSKPFDLSKPPSSYTEAVACLDAHVWHSAMDQERQSLTDMGAFKEVELPKGECTISLKWVFNIKTDANGECLYGKEKAHLVTQGFNQRPGQFDETYAYAPVTKMASVRILLAWAAVKDLENFQFDCKTAFLHAKVRHPLFSWPLPGFPISNPGMCLCILVALYGLCQSAYEFYILILSLLLEFGMVWCEVDHGVFFGKWTSPPDPSINMPLDGSPLVLYIPLHVDDSLGIMNSAPLYAWFISVLSKQLHIVDLGPCAKFLNILIIHDCPRRHLLIFIFQNYSRNGTWLPVDQPQLPSLLLCLIFLQLRLILYLTSLMLICYLNINVW